MRLVPWFNSQTKMIQIQAVCAWRWATAPTELAFRVDDVDKGGAGPQLVQPIESTIRSTLQPRIFS